MIYVLFGPPGVGKTYIGQLVSKVKGWHFFDADILYDDELKFLLRSGKYSQEIRDVFIRKLIIATESLLTKGVNNLVIAEAFTKEKNRIEFLDYFDQQVCYIMVDASKKLAGKRMKARLKKGEHVVDNFVFEFVWDEFENPKIPCRKINNENSTDLEIGQVFEDVVESAQKEV